MMLAAMLGILKAGGAYVPLDSEHPSERLKSVVEQAQTPIIVSQSALVGKLSSIVAAGEHVQTVLFVDDAVWAPPFDGIAMTSREAWAAEEPHPLDSDVGPDDLMTVLFTSGSTGKPKGVMLNHRGYTNRLAWMQSAFPLKPGDRVAQRTSCGFDISVWELFWPLMYGATVCPVDRAVTRDPWQLSDWMRQRRINVMHFVPSHFVEFLNSIAHDVEFPDLRWLVFSGEALSASVIRRWMDRYGTRVGLANLYGPTEASIDVTCHIIDRMPEADERIPIGTAIDNAHLVVLGEAMLPCARGQLGELWIGGIAIARGYLRNPEATAKAFHANPFPHIPGKWLYRTGDLATQSEDGTFHFHGRIDTQVKIRGFRIELGEVEAILGSHPTVSEVAATVIDGADGHPQLVAAVAARTGDPGALRQFLKERVPDYMVPHRIEVMASLPKNENGKLDRKALFARCAAPPLGGPKNAAPNEMVLGPAQRWIVRYFDPPHAWFGFTRVRYTKQLDLGSFQRAVDFVVESNGALRASFHREGDKWIQRIADRVATPVQIVDGSRMSDAELDAAIQELMTQTCDRMRIEKAPLFHVILVTLADASCEIAMLAHHLVGDLLSGQTLFAQVWRRYADLLGRSELDANRAARAPGSYTDYVNVLEDARTSGALDEHLAYWRARFESAPSFDFAADFEGGLNEEASSAREVLELDEERTRALMAASKGVYKSSLYHLLLAPVYRAIGRCTGRSSVILSHRSHGRDLGGGRTFFDAVGNFAVNFPVCVDLRQDDDWPSLVRRIADEFARLPMNGVTYDLVGDRLSEKIYPDHKLTPIRVNYLGNRTIVPSKLFVTRREDRDQRYATPGQKRTTLIEIFLEVSNGRLRIDIDYSRNIYSSRTIGRLSAEIGALLQEISAAAPSQRAAETAGGLAVVRSPAANGGHRKLTATGEALRDRVAIITGAGCGIGKTTALLFARNGARLVIVSRSEEQARGCVSEIERVGGRAIGVCADVSNPADVDRLVARCVERFGGLDILVNGTHVPSVATFAESPMEHWRRVAEVNLFGAYYCGRATIPQLLARGGGKIINVSSGGVSRGPMSSAYAASEHGVIGLTKAWADELKPHNIQVNAVCPAVMDGATARDAAHGESIAGERAADAILFFASRPSDGISGETMRVLGQPSLAARPGETFDALRDGRNDLYSAGLATLDRSPRRPATAALPGE
jgi:amino acid adenylation domain-containing protein